MTIIIAR